MCRFWLCWMFFFPLHSFAADLAEDWQWKRLLHVRNGASIIQDEAFYLNKHARSPVSELLITRELIESPEELGEEVCRFPARFKWVARKLGKRFSIPHRCRSYWNFKSSLDAGGLSLVFSTEYLSNPASMFGHTMIRIDRQSSLSLLSHAVAFGGKIDDAPGLIYAFKGIFGYYSGRFTVAPYYQVINQYAEGEGRDLWELPLDVSQFETDLFVDHLYELRDIGIDYYFFSDNCAQLLLELLAVVKPQMDPGSLGPLWVFPTDLVLYTRDLGLIRKAIYRPAPEQKLWLMEQHHQRQILTSENYRQLSERDQALHLDYRILDTKIKYLAGKLRPSAYRSRYLQLLSERSQLSEKSSRMSYQSSYKLLKAHYPQLFGLGYSTEGASLLRWRPAFHGVWDRPGGLKQGSLLSILDSSISFKGDGKIELEKLNLFHIASWRSWTPLRKPLAWEVEGRYDRMEPDSYLLSASLGASWRFKLLQLVALVGPAIHNTRDDLNYQASVVGKTYLRLHVGRFFLNWRNTYLWNEIQSSFRSKVGLSIDLGNQLALELQGKRNGWGEHHAYAGVIHYF